MKKMNKKIIFIFLIALILIGIGVRFLSLDKAFTAEEGDFVRAAIAWEKTGHPLFYQSEQVQENLALWHPPMYIFLLSAILKFSTSEIAIRGVNAVFSILTAGIIFLFCFYLIEEKRGKIIGLISSAFFLINYYILSSSLLIDLDASSTFFVFSFIFFILMGYKTQKTYYSFLAGLSLFFGLFNRYPMAVLAYFFIGLYYYFNKELKKDFKKYILIGILSLLSFILVWGVYSTFIEPGNFFSFLSHNVEYGAEQFKNLTIYIGSFVLNIVQFVRLFTLPAIILMIWAFFSLSKEDSKLIRVLLSYILPILIFFIIVPRPAFGYPRYFMTMFPGVSILLGIFLYKHLNKASLNKKEIMVIFISFIISIILLLIFKPQLTLYAGNGLIKATNLPDLGFNILGSLPLIFVFLIKNNKKRIAILILISLILSYSLYFDAGYVFNNSHIKEVANYIKERTNESDIILAPKPIGFYADRRFYINDNNKPDLNFSLGHLEEYIIKSYENRNMDDEFFWPKGFYSSFYDYPKLPSEEDLEKAVYVVLYHPVDNLFPEKKIGEFYIYINLNN